MYITHTTNSYSFVVKTLNKIISKNIIVIVVMGIYKSIQISKIKFKKNLTRNDFIHFFVVVVRNIATVLLYLWY